MDVWFCILQEPPPRGNNRELKDLEKLFHALLLSASGELLPLDKDLSWMSVYSCSALFATTQCYDSPSGFQRSLLMEVLQFYYNARFWGF
jgi:hypothetical protein